MSVIYAAALLFLALVSNGPCFAQYENVWAFGEGCGMDFNSTVGPVNLSTSMESKEASASICNDQGQLLFYTNGYTVWNRLGVVMPNGYNLIEDEALPSPGATSLDAYTSSSTQGALIIPWPENQDKYFIFSMTSYEVAQQRLYYSVVDMNLNGGMGDVVFESKGIFVGGGRTEQMIGVVGDRCNVWLLTVSNVDSALLANNITSEGIDMTSVNSPLLPCNYLGIFGSMDASPDRRKLAIARGGYGLYDFDPATGIATGIVELAKFQVGKVAYSACFSHNNTKLYLTSVTSTSFSGTPTQFDLTSNDSQTVVNSAYDMSSVNNASSFKRGPDGKVYGALYGQKFVIQNPELGGVACQFEEVELPGVSGTGFCGVLPNNVPVIPHDTFYTQQVLSAGCFASHTLVAAIDDSTGWDYVWNTGSSETTIIADTPGIYWVSYRTPPCNFYTDTFHVGFPNGVLPTIHIDTACVEATNGAAYASTYLGDTVNYTYIWLSGSDTLSMTDSLSAIPSGNYTLLIHTVNCDTNLNFIVPEVDYRVGFSASDTLLCMGDTLHFQNTSDGHFNQFAWYFGDGDSSLSVTAPGYAYSHHGNYEIVLTGGGTICRDTARQYVVVDSFFAITFKMDQSEICMGDGISFQLPDADSSFIGLHWDWGDSSYLYAGYENSFYHAFDSSGSFPIRIILHARACPDTSFTDTLRVYTLPKVDLGPDTSLCLDGRSIVLQNQQAPPAETHHYLWNSGDTSVRMQILQPGRYSLRVTTEPLGCYTEDEIEIIKDCYTDIPNAFTPNGDGDNDYFFPRTQLSKSVSNFKMQVFNRWGQVVFESTNIDGRGWDGRFNNKDQPAGVYVYLVVVDYTNGRQEEYQGNVTLIR